MKEQDVPVLSLLSKPLKMDLKMEEFGPIISQHPFFESWSKVDLVKPAGSVAVIFCKPMLDPPKGAAAPETLGSPET